MWLLRVGGIALCTLAHLGRDIRANVLFFAVDCSEVCCLGILCDAKNRRNPVPFMTLLFVFQTISCPAHGCDILVDDNTVM